MPTNPLRLISGAALLVAAALTLTPACSDQAAPTPAPAPDPSAAALDGPFVPIYRETSRAVLETRQAALSDAAGTPMAPVTQDFYIALSKKELGQKWFLSAYLSQMAPNGVASGAARSLGTRVVSFKVQNGKLFMFDVADDKEWSDTFRPEVVLEAYPLVEGFAPFDRLRGAPDYVLFDPAAGLNRFRLLQDTWAPIEVELSFSQRFRKIPDGATFEQVFSGVVRQFTISSSTPTIIGPPSQTGTLSLGLRRYRESEGFQATALPPVDHFFRSPSRLVPNEGVRRSTALKWKVAAGAPIVWKIAGLAAELQATPEYAGIDLGGAIKRGIESWNVAFGFHALEADLAEPGQSFGDDDVNYFILDSHRTYGGAFANLRSNPNTGEIRGASVYFPLTFFRSYPPPTPVALGGPSEEMVQVEGPSGAPSGAPPAARFGWGGAVEESLCERGLPSLAEIAELAPADLPPLSRKEKIERLLAHIAAHEVGHTLGLRHNFKGSLRPPSSSVMEYVVDEDSIVMNDSLGSYDIAAIRYLYGLSPSLPTDSFCTDEQADVVDPDCRRFDVGAVPLRDAFIPLYQDRLAPFLAGASNSLASPSVLAAHLRLAADGAVRLQAYEAAFAPLRQPAPPPTPLPSFASRVDFVTRLALQVLFVDPLPGQPLVNGQPPPAPAPPRAPVLAAAIADLHAVLVNQDQLRSAATRRLAIDILKRFQSTQAFAALAAARGQLTEQLPALTDGPAIETTDLLARIDRVLGAYFD